MRSAGAGGRGVELPGWDLGGAGMRGNRMSPHTTHLAVPAGRGVLGGAAFPAEFPRGVVELGEDGLGEVGIPPGQLEQEPGAGNERAQVSSHCGCCSDWDGARFCAAPDGTQFP